MGRTRTSHLTTHYIEINPSTSIRHDVHTTSRRAASSFRQVSPVQEIRSIAAIRRVLTIRDWFEIHADLRYFYWLANLRVSIMSEKATAVVRIKAKVLKDHVAEMRKMLSASIVDKPNLLLRLTDLTTSFHKYEDAYENLCILEKESSDIAEWSVIRELYYAIAADINKFKTQDASLINQSLPNALPGASSTFLEKQRTLKLPIAEVPKFGGNHNQWLSYKNAFLSMVDGRSDIDDTVKFLYLRNSLESEALRKIEVYDIRSENYAKAWETLISNYERKRILVSKHIDAILGISPLKSATAKELSSLVDDVKQHLNMLEVLKVKVDGRIVVRLLERALPVKIREKWEEALSLDELPSLEKLLKFINDTTYRLRTLENDDSCKETTPNASESAGTSRSVKFRKGNDGARALVTNVDIPCPQCKGAHALYRCNAFKNLSVSERLGVARTNKLCFNCLRQHKGKCGMGHCKTCEKYHNTLLHSENDSSTPQPPSDSTA